MEIIQAAALIIATLTVGLMAGVFAIYANAIMPGLGRTDDRTFVGAFQSIDTAIINPLFLMTFLGSLLSTGVAAALQLGEDDRSVLLWIFGRAGAVPGRIRHDPEGQRTAQRRYQGGRSARSHCRSRSGAGAVQRSKVGPLEPHSGSRDDRRIRLSRIGPSAFGPRLNTGCTPSTATRSLIASSRASTSTPSRNASSSETQTRAHDHLLRTRDALARALRSMW